MYVPADEHLKHPNRCSRRSDFLPHLAGAGGRRPGQNFFPSLTGDQGQLRGQPGKVCQASELPSGFRAAGALSVASAGLAPSNGPSPDRRLPSPPPRRPPSPPPHAGAAQAASPRWQRPSACAVEPPGAPRPEASLLTRVRGVGGLLWCRRGGRGRPERGLRARGAGGGGGTSGKAGGFSSLPASASGPAQRRLSSAVSSAGFPGRARRTRAPCGQEQSRALARSGAHGAPPSCGRRAAWPGGRADPRRFLAGQIFYRSQNGARSKPAQRSAAGPGRTTSLPPAAAPGARARRGAASTNGAAGGRGAQG